MQQIFIDHSGEEHGALATMHGPFESVEEALAAGFHLTDVCHCKSCKKLREEIGQ